MYAQFYRKRRRWGAENALRSVNIPDPRLTARPAGLGSRSSASLGPKCDPVPVIGERTSPSRWPDQPYEQTEAIRRRRERARMGEDGCFNLRESAFRLRLLRSVLAPSCANGARAAQSADKKRTPARDEPASLPCLEPATTESRRPGCRAATSEACRSSA